ncbi:MAG TPA: FtsX-like permease family protein [Solirubrobacteraceae bacterium]|nr:FtsX-like permease family protein [Solirubrobacteraceae bacterium]
MTRLALRGLAARKLRTSLTIIAVLLGVTMIAGTFVLTDTIQKAFDDIFASSTKGADVIVSGREQVDTEFTMPRPLDESVLDDIRALPDVEQVAGQINDVAAVVGKDGKVVSTGGAPTIAATYMPKPFEPIGFSEGRPPRGPDEVAIDASTADKEEFAVGDTVTVAAGGPKRSFKLVGLATLGQSAGLGGATFVVFDLPTAQALFAKRDRVDFAFVAAKPGVSQADLQRQVASILPSSAQVRTAAQEADKAGADIREGLSFLTTGLLAFAFIAVLVGAFLIFNTFSITVAQRSRELALLRTLGATRRQVLSSVMLEALTIGVLGSVIGILAGLGFATAINELFKALGIDLPTTDLVLAGRTIVVCLLVGTIVTLLGALAPAVRATRVAPVEALREASAPTHGRFQRVLPWLAGLLILGGAGLVVAGLLAEGGDTSTKLLGAAGGAVILILGIAVISPRFVGPAARVVAAPVERATKLVGRLARENSTRHPGRTAVTSAALMVGLALVVFVTIFANGLRASIEDLIDRTLAGDIAVLHEDGFTPIPAAVGPAIAKVEGVGAVSAIRDTQARIKGVSGTKFTHAIDPATIGEVYNFDWKEGSQRSLDELGDDGVLLEENLATDGKFKVGDRVEITGPSGEVQLTVRGIYADDALLEGITMGPVPFDELAEQKRVSSVLVKTDQGASVPTVQRGVTRALAAFPEARARSQQELKDENADQVNQLLGLFYALLAMSVIISAFGIVNTLTLSIFERTRELGLLRAVGMTRRDVRRMVRYESVITAVFGALLGLVLGVFFAFVVIQALSGEGIAFSLPIGQIVSLLIFAIVVGVVAAIIPARRASRLDVLKAIAYE